MGYEEVITKLNEIFCNVFDDDAIVLSDSTSASDIPEWDSLMHVTLISEIEDEFELHLDMKTIRGLKNVGDMVSVICDMKR